MNLKPDEDNALEEGLNGSIFADKEIAQTMYPMFIPKVCEHRSCIILITEDIYTVKTYP